MKEPNSSVPFGAPWAERELPAEWLLQAADALALPTALLTAAAELVYSNAAFQRVLADPAGPLRLRAGRLLPAHPEAAGAFAVSVSAAAQGGPVALKAAVDGLQGHLAPLTMPALAGGQRPLPVCLVLTIERHDMSVLDLYAAQYGLTAAETRVLKSAAGGAQPEQTARRFGLKVATVRGHLISIRRKTSHASQQALLLELARLPPVAEPHVPR